jgi:HAD superfamily hydrolase (TIGR01549 family)
LIDKSNITTILFDLDGTIRYTKPDGNHLFREFVRSKGFEITKETEFLSMAWTHKFWADSQDFSNDVEEYGRGTEKFWENYSRRHLLSLGLSEEYATEMSVPVREYMGSLRENYQDDVPDEAYTMLKELRENGYCLGLVTNRGEPIAELVEKLDLQDKFDFYLYAGEVDSWKPDEKIFLEALSRAGASPEQTVYVGDNYYADVVGSKNAGIFPIFIDPVGWMDDPDCMVIRNIGEITEIFSKE